MITTTYTNARTHLAEFLDAVVDGRETVLIQRRGREDVALISAAELNSLLETAHLLRSPKNAARLLAALERARAQTEPTSTLQALQEELGTADEPA
jgi:antitoxin YefM